ncbi:hypothetical protein F5883DRAFT_640419 [Diaporthe sp. PMI_573]|nr:hypothetical protein F5883DRAFT_640419 [Diaporthaceae sp. PMI_573]
MVSCKNFSTAIIMGLSTVVSAHPTQDPGAREIEVRDVISVTMYRDTNWIGTSASFSITTQTQCYGLNGGQWTNVISSIRVPTGYRCRLWNSNSCNGDSTPDIYAPGAQALPAGMNDKATSFKCYKTKLVKYLICM